MLPNFSSVRTCRPPTPGGRDRLGALEHPVRLVEVVAVLLDDEVAREPGEVVPVAHLVLHRVVLVVRAAVPERAGQVGDVHGRHVADRAVVDALDRLAFGLVVAVAVAGAEAEVLLLRELRGLEHRCDAGDVHGHRLLAEDVLAGLDRGIEMQRPEARRACRAARRRRTRAVSCSRRSRRNSDPAGHRPWPRCRGSVLRFERLVSSRSMKASHIATSLTFGSARGPPWRAPVPRPPQPTRPTRSVSSPAA